MLLIEWKRHTRDGLSEEQAYVVDPIPGCSSSTYDSISTRDQIVRVCLSTSVYRQHDVKSMNRSRRRSKNGSESLSRPIDWCCENREVDDQAVVAEVECDSRMLTVA